MALSPPPHDTAVVFADDAGTEYAVGIPRQGHSNREVRTVAYRWLCKCIAEGEYLPYGECRYVRMEGIG